MAAYSSVGECIIVLKNSLIQQPLVVALLKIFLPAFLKFIKKIKQP